jgi:hypothetical protein
MRPFILPGSVLTMSAVMSQSHATCPVACCRALFPRLVNTDNDMLYNPLKQGLNELVLTIREVAGG